MGANAVSTAGMNVKYATGATRPTTGRAARRSATR